MNAPESLPALPFSDLRSQYLALKPSIQARIDAVLEHGRYIMGPEVEECEKALAGRIGSSHCITVASGTEALLIAMMAKGIGPGDEVITTPFTFAATAETILLLGATPVFVDIEPDTCNIDAALIDAAVTERSRAIVPVSLYGQTADMDEINAIGARHGLCVIEDAAQSFGGRYKGRASGNLSEMSTTSFFPSKPLGCYGDGGAIFTNDDELAQACREIRVHGQSERYWHTRIGVGGRMDTLQCAVVLAKLERFDWELEARDRLARRYRERIAALGLPVEPTTVRPDRSSAWAQFTIVHEDRDGIAARLQAVGVPVAIHYPRPLHLQPAYAERSRSLGCAISEKLAKTVLSLPLSPDLSESDQDRIVDALAHALRRQ